MGGTGPEGTGTVTGPDKNRVETRTFGTGVGPSWDQGGTGKDGTGGRTEKAGTWIRKQVVGGV